MDPIFGVGSARRLEMTSLNLFRLTSVAEQEVWTFPRSTRMADPENRQEDSRWRQIGIALLASALTAVMACGGGGVLLSGNSSFGRSLGGLLVALGLASIFIFV